MMNNRLDPTGIKCLSSAPAKSLMYNDFGGEG